MRGAPHKGFAAAILLTRAEISAGTGGPPTGRSVEVGPVLPEATALPSQDGVGRDDDQCLSPTGPDSGQADPEQTIHRVEPWPGRRSLIDGELLAQGQVLEGEPAVAADEEGEEPEQGSRRADHRAGIVPIRDREIKIKHLPPDEVLAKDRRGRTRSRWSRRVIIEPGLSPDPS